MLSPPIDAAPSADWTGLSDVALPVAEAAAWAVTPSCGAVVSFVGTVRDHTLGRDDVSGLTYEAYEAQAGPRLRAVADEARRRFPGLGRLVLLHRTGDLALCEAAVVVVAAAPHRDEAFAAARYAIDAVKATVPIWKHERWAGGVDVGTGAQVLVDAGGVASVGSAASA